MSVRDEDLPLSRLELGEKVLLESLLGDKFDKSFSSNWDPTLNTSAVHLFVGGGGRLAWLLVDEGIFESLWGDVINLLSSSSSSSIGCDIKLKTSADHLTVDGCVLLFWPGLRKALPCSVGSGWFTFRARFSSEDVCLRNPVEGPNMLRKEAIVLWLAL